MSQSGVLQEEKGITNDQDPTGKTVGSKTQAQSRGKWDSICTTASAQGNQEQGAKMAAEGSRSLCMENLKEKKNLWSRPEVKCETRNNAEAGAVSDRT